MGCRDAWTTGQHPTEVRRVYRNTLNHPQLLAPAARPPGSPQPQGISARSVICLLFCFSLSVISGLGVCDPWWPRQPSGVHLPQGQNRRCASQVHLIMCNPSLTFDPSNDQKPNLLRAERHGYAVSLDWDDITGNWWSWFDPSWQRTSWWRASGRRWRTRRWRRAWRESTPSTWTGRRGRWTRWPHPA